MSSLKAEYRPDLSRRFMLLAPLALVACGFQPSFAPGETGATLYGRILVDVPKDQNSYFVTREIEERLGRSNDAAYSLSFRVRIRQRRLAVNQEGNAGRFHFLGRLNYTLRDLNTGQVVSSDVLTNFVGFSATGNTVVTFAGKRDARERLMNILADQLVTQLLALDLTE